MSSDLKVRYECQNLSRLQKTAIVSDSPTAMRMMQCYWQNNGIPEGINCGPCGKFVRTIVQLAALRRLDRAETLPTVPITPDLIESLGFTSEADLEFFEECVEPFRASGRTHLLRAIQARVKRYRDGMQGRAGAAGFGTGTRNLKRGRLTQSARRVLRTFGKSRPTGI